MKVTLDANVVVSAFATRGLCSEVFAYCLSEHTIITSRFIIDEVSKSLEEDFGMPKEKTEKHRKFLESATKVVIPLDVRPCVCRAPKDLKILGTAWSDKADVIVTGDKHLLELKEFKDIAILTVRKFWGKSRGLDM